MKPHYNTIIFSENTHNASLLVWPIRTINPTDTENGIFKEIVVNTMATDTLATTFYKFSHFILFLKGIQNHIH